MFENTNKTLREIANELNIGYKGFRKYIERTYSQEEIMNRKKSNYSKSKLEEKNPMFGKTKSNHHNYIGEVSDGKGYIMILKPEWYTGRKGCKHVFKHHIVMCEMLGITEIPSGYCVHHIDENPVNNTPENLALLTMGAHTRLHQMLRRATTIPQGSRKS